MVCGLNEMFISIIYIIDSEWISSESEAGKNDVLVSMALQVSFKLHWNEKGQWPKYIQFFKVLNFEEG